MSGVCGQNGGRDREKAHIRRSIADLLAMGDVTLKSFLNGNQKGLGEGPRNRLLALDPAFRELYDAYSNVCGPTTVRDESERKLTDQVTVQLTFAVEESQETVV